MAKWSGKIGFATTEEVETESGIWEKKIVERQYYGDLVRNTRRLQPTNSVNDNIVIANDISIVADPYARDNLHTIRYAEFMGTKWKISNIDVQYPRLNLTLGDVYNA